MLAPVALRKADWTVLVLLNGNNDLEPNVTRDLVDLEQVGSDDSVRLVAQLTRKDQTTRRYEVEQVAGRNRKVHSAPVEELPNQDHGDPATLRDFLRWGMERYPARHYLVVVGDHGKGFLGTGFDERHEGTLELPELREALQGNAPDVLVMDACLMSQLEVAHELKDSAGFLVGSEEIIGQDGLPHVAILDWLRAHPKCDPRELAEAVVELSESDQLDRMENDRPDAAVQLSALDLARVDPVSQASDRLAALLMEERVPRSTLKYLIGRTQRFNPDSEARPERDFRDLGHFAARLLASPKVTDPEVRSAAEDLRSSLGELLVRQQNAGDGVEEATGLSVYLPGKTGKPRAQYDQTAFAQSTRWDEMLTWLSA